MLKRLTIRNYKSISDLTVEFGQWNLLIGLNGSGKSCVFEVLAGLRELIGQGGVCEKIFPLSSVPGWIPANEQVVLQEFKLEMDGPFGTMSFELSVEQDRAAATSLVVLERVTRGAEELFLRTPEGLNFARESAVQQTPMLLLGGSQSMFWLFPADIAPLRWIRHAIPMATTFGIAAPRMGSRSEAVASSPTRDFSNFVSWYRMASHSDLSAAAGFLGAVREVIAGLESLNLRDLGQGHMILEGQFRGASSNGISKQPNGERYILSFDQLSDGQRALIALYATIHFLVKEGATICIDEPDAYLALAEVQPWLNAIKDASIESGAQLIFASHHPELMNLLAPEYGILLERDGSGPTHARKFPSDDESPLLPAERVARGYE